MTIALVPGSNSTPLNLLEYEAYAKEYLPKNAYDYYASGANEMITLSENRQAFKRFILHPRVLRDVSILDTSTILLGHSISSPICVAPSAMHCMAHPDGEKASTIATAKANTCYILSTISTTSLEDVAKASREANSHALRWYQLYVFKDRELTRGLVTRAEEAGYKAIVLTVDTPMLGHREPDVRNGFSLPNHLTMANFTHIGGAYEHGVNGVKNSGLAKYVSELFDPTLNWNDVKWLKSITNLPVVVKGVLSPEDAKIAVEMGCQAVDGRAEVYMDGGVRRGTDVFKALALGARAVFLGRPILFGLAHSGEEGVSNVLRLLNEELKHAMLFSGTAKLADIGPAYVRRDVALLPSSL
ncbi:unnamed protein product [Peronospora belbahrii]|uniref:FMN hydroxy acid dehydrogenase domain-containing protein n=1 Tax=Peronospora belbahrii TaxID=622444 RepID=A0ABN8CU44_9STRA|nr:unnamed protein product [Peronospora belbahrii]